MEALSLTCRVGRGWRIWLGVRGHAGPMGKTVFYFWLPTGGKVNLTISPDVISSRFLYASSITSYHFTCLHNIPYYGILYVWGCSKFNIRYINKYLHAQVFLKLGCMLESPRELKKYWVSGIPLPSESDITDEGCFLDIGIFQRSPQMLICSWGWEPHWSKSFCGSCDIRFLVHSLLLVDHRNLFCFLSTWPKAHKYSPPDAFTHVGNLITAL